MSVEHKRKGLVLIAVLWVVIILTVIISSISRSGRLNMKISFVAQDSVCCKWSAIAGLETAIAVLKEDLTASDSLLDLWSDNEDDFNDIELGTCRFTARVFDEAGKLNINTATKEQLLALPDMTEQIASAIIDWRDEDENQTSDGVEGGYYENLPYRYQIRNGPFRTIRELLMVRGVTKELLYGEDTNLNGQLDSNERDGSTSPPDDNEDGRLDKGWIEYLTCYSYDKNTDAEGNERVNINDADEKKLTESLGISESHAKWIVENRKNKQYESIADLIDKNSPKESKGRSNNDSDARAEPLDFATFSNIADKITVGGGNQISGKVNINTAPGIVLEALLGGDEKANQLAENIENYRSTLLNGMESIADMLNVPSMDVDSFKKIANQITVRSNVFTVRSFATSERGLRGAKLQIEAVVDRAASPYQILYFYQGETN